MKLKLSLLTAALALWQAPSFGASITYSQQLVANDNSSFNSFGGGQNNHYSFETYYAAGFNQFAQFDTSLGTLESMDLNIGLSWSGNTHFNHMSVFGPPTAGSANDRWDMQYFRVGSLGLDGRFLWETTGLPTDSDPLSVPIGGSADGALSLTGNLTKHIDDADLLSVFNNGFTLFIDTKSKYSYSAWYATGGLSAPDLTVDFSYTFNYSPTVVPEPSTIALGAIAGVLVLGFRRKLRS